MDPRSFYLFIFLFSFLFFFQIFLKKLRVLLLPRKSQLSMWTLPAPDDLVASKGYSLYKIRQSGHLLPHLYLMMSKGWPFKLLIQFSLNIPNGHSNQEDMVYLMICECVMSSWYPMRQSLYQLPDTITFRSTPRHVYLKTPAYNFFTESSGERVWLILS